LDGDQPVARLLPTQRRAKTWNNRTETSMSRVGFEPKTSVFQRAKTVPASDRATTVIGKHSLLLHDKGTCCRSVETEPVPMLKTKWVLLISARQTCSPFACPAPQPCVPLELLRSNCACSFYRLQTESDCQVFHILDNY
jgi:hypothetical protein